ncbi:MAG: dihydrofolate reductase [Levilactobacillus sp.]|jgi:dihydrofolate reductase|uniref:dihydrofolate reductase n=1 Tax=Levilactobacillus sp. TaxID=2767919 RepID=UPI00258DEBAB|nr:dihydrofolate reductase [Levilactobacillus sp.]MCH4123317.1 dihydrofolate reductase [Levilactobacillus sp.]MCI1552545.1 dihydrofolate reductase [Levilactobacillus sp.]
MLIFLWAESQGHVIGFHGQLPWHLPADMHYFKTVTMDNTIVTGAKTFASFPGLLPNRTNIIVSHRPASDFPAEAIVLNSLDAVRAYAAERPTEKIFVIGGAQIFAGLIDDVDYLYRTNIEAGFDGDTWMPAIDYSKFQLIDRQPGVRNEKNPYDFTFEQYQRL